ncbi:hypothetical protein CLPU_1c00830 [Gottschalkia purinilytica]|uniref:Division initiation protein n=1 Tax=Gottschalkia purinilytica TaxID=1503 RepID=A0A0L0WEL3_GOTPU|nr:DUF881 domain-containing protein [Gottschalkia purinilytica]KNF09918.1 hypothetical protein CLPU_1c00830 [Gottschalkia purinilytica]
MNNIRSKIAITAVCVILGIVLAIQFKTVENLDSNVIPTQRSKQIAIEYKKLKDEREKMRKELDELEKKVAQYEKGEADKDTFLENLYKDIQKYKMLSGYEDLKGKGITIQIDDPPADVKLGDDKSTIVQNYELLLQVINILNAAEAEAISINDQRYTSFTEIVPAGNHIEINGVSFGAPFVIKAIGKSEDLESALRVKGGIIWYMEKGFNLQVNIKQDKNIVIPRYKRVKDFIYSKPSEEQQNR